MEIFFLRHGETLWNREKRVQGSTPHVDLTEFGVKLAELTREGFAAKGIRFDKAFTSPLRRALHTAEIVMQGQSCPLVVEPRLREMGFGPYEGTIIADGFFVDANIRACFREPQRYAPPPGAESFAAVEARLVDFMEGELRPLEGSCERVLVVSHGGMMRTVLRHLLKTPLSEYWNGRQPNCCVHIVKLEGGQFSLVRQTEVFYDPAIAATVPSV